MRIVRVTSVPFFLLHHLRGQIDATVAAGHAVTVVSSPVEGADALARWQGVRYEAIHIQRRISPIRDLLAVWRLYRFFRAHRPDIVHSATPKAGLLCALAGWRARVPVRLHTFTGQAWAERTGIVRHVGKLADRLIIGLSTRTYADSQSQCEYLVQEGVARTGQVHVLGAGSLGGVNLSRLNRADHRAAGEAIAQRLGIPDGTKVIVFIGRVNRDKGVAELIEASSLLLLRGIKHRLILVGPFEPDLDPLPAPILARIHDDSTIDAMGYDPEPEKYLTLADVLCLPSYREGFGNVVIEAAVMGVPTVGTDIVGLRDAVENGVTGILVPPKNAAALADALGVLLSDDARRRSLGKAARERATRLFDARIVNSLVLQEYERLGNLPGGARS